MIASEVLRLRVGRFAITGLVCAALQLALLRLLEVTPLPARRFAIPQIGRAHV